MKNILFACAITLLGFNSCSKDEQPTADQASYKVEVSHTGDVSAFQEFMTVTIFAEKIDEVALKGLSVDKREEVGGFANFLVNGKAKNRSFETSNNVQAVLVSDIFSKSGEDGKISTTIAIYKNGSLVKKKKLDYDGTGNNILNIGSDE